MDTQLGLGAQHCEAEKYKVICFKCKVTIGPNTPNIRWIICQPCNELLGGV